MFTKEWMFEDSVYGETCMKAIMASPAERLEMVDKWMNTLYKETEEAWRYEAWAHAEIAMCVAKDMGNRTVEPWDCKQDWQDYVRCSLNNVHAANIGRNEGVKDLLKRGYLDLFVLAGRYEYIAVGDYGCIMRNSNEDEQFFELHDMDE